MKADKQAKLQTQTSTQTNKQTKQKQNQDSCNFAAQKISQTQTKVNKRTNKQEIVNKLKQTIIGYLCFRYKKKPGGHAKHRK